MPLGPEEAGAGQRPGAEERAVSSSPPESLVRASLPWVLPFAVFMLLLALLPVLELPVVWDQVVRLVVVGGVLVAVSRPVLDFRVRSGFRSILLGVAVFVVWIGPDLIAPGWRSSWLFSNDIVGRPESGFPEAGRASGVALGLRFARAAVLVPIVEELFWRGWLPRVIMEADFRKVPLGSFTPAAFVITAVLFATEHGSWWDVGLAAGLIYNWWMMRTRSLGDLMLAHAVTNACLSAWVVGAGKWAYW